MAMNRVSLRNPVSLSISTFELSSLECYNGLMVRGFVRGLVTIVSLLLLAAAITFLYIGWRINRTGTHDLADRADAIVVLGARVEPDGQPGPDLRVRTLHAVNLFQRGLAPYIICTGGYRDDRLSAASVACRLAIAQGVPADKVLLADGSMTTREDAIGASQLILDRGWTTAILVSHPLHLERARLLFDSQGISVFPSPTNTNLTSIPWRTRAWLTAREALGIVSIGLEELGLPAGWSRLVSRWVYSPGSTPELN
jgi:uncharacterized SAM-binding protein YcdF (DUF218 family)